MTIEVIDAKIVTVLDSEERFEEIAMWITRAENICSGCSWCYLNSVDGSFRVTMTDEIYQRFALEFFGVFHRVN